MIHSLKLYRVSIISKNSWDKKKRILYAMHYSKEKAIDYVEENMRYGFKIHKVYYLGYELGSRMYSGGKESK